MYINGYLVLRSVEPVSFLEDEITADVVADFSANDVFFSWTQYKLDLIKDLKGRLVVNVDLEGFNDDLIESGNSHDLLPENFANFITNYLLDDIYYECFGPNQEDIVLKIDKFVLETVNDKGRQSWHSFKSNVSINS